MAGKDSRVSFPLTWGGEKKAGVEFEKAMVYGSVQDAFSMSKNKLGWGEWVTIWRLPADLSLHPYRIIYELKPCHPRRIRFDRGETGRSIGIETDWREGRLEGRGGSWGPILSVGGI